MENNKKHQKNINRAEELMDKEMLSPLDTFEKQELKELMKVIQKEEDKVKIPKPTEKGKREFIQEHKASQCMTCINYLSLTQYLHTSTTFFQKCLKLDDEIHKDSIIQDCTQYEVNKKIKN